MFKLTSEKILKEQYVNPAMGAYITFDGIVRNHNEGKSVAKLEYQAYEEMAEQVGEDIVRAAYDKFDILDAFCIHRVGELAIGESAVLIGVASKHRAAGFDACRFIIDEVKLLVPIWKKEFYVNERPKWVACHQCSHPGSQS